MKHYLRSGASAYLYWNISLKKGGVSRWGWAQNSLVTVDPGARTYAYTHEYWLMKHLSAFVRPGARRLEAVSWSGYENQLAFANPDGTSTEVAGVRDSIGAYHADFLPETPGIWYYRVTGAGAIVAAIEGSFAINALKADYTP